LIKIASAIVDVKEGKAFTSFLYIGKIELFLSIVDFSDSVLPTTKATISLAVMVFLC
jgi:hypothetical protein